MVMPRMSDRKASQMMPCPGSALAMSRVYSPNPASDTDMPSSSDTLVSPTCSSTGRKFSGMGMPSASVADDPVGQDDDPADAIGAAVEQELQPEVAAGDRQDAVRQATRRVGQRHLPVPQRSRPRRRGR